MATRIKASASAVRRRIKRRSERASHKKKTNATLRSRKQRARKTARVMRGGDGDVMYLCCGKQTYTDPNDNSKRTLSISRKHPDILEKILKNKILKVPSEKTFTEEDVEEINTVVMSEEPLNMNKLAEILGVTPENIRKETTIKKTHGTMNMPIKDFLLKVIQDIKAIETYINMKQLLDDNLIYGILIRTSVYEWTFVGFACVDEREEIRVKEKKTIQYGKNITKVLQFLSQTTESINMDQQDVIEKSGIISIIKASKAMWPRNNLKLIDDVTKREITVKKTEKMPDFDLSSSPDIDFVDVTSINVLSCMPGWKKFIVDKFVNGYGQLDKQNIAYELLNKLQIYLSDTCKTLFEYDISLT